MKQLTITRKNGDKYRVKVDDRDGHLLKKHNWCVIVKGDTPYVARMVWKHGTSSAVYLHQLICGKAPKGFHTDHINRNTLDNRRSNLRVVSGSHNVQNSRLSTTNTSGYRGVSWFKRYEVWEAYISQHGKRMWLGYYDDIDDAARAYNKAARELYGPKCMVNRIAA